MKIIKLKPDFAVDCTTVKVKCREEITLYTDDKSKLRELEKEVVTKAFLHERNCSRCASIRKYEEEDRERNSIWRVESTAKCGEVLFVEKTNPSEVEKTRWERGVCHQVAEHRRTCIKCIRMEKLDNIKCLTK